MGAGISGLAAAHYLRSRYEITVFEAGARVGGHTVTTLVPSPEGPVAVDAGFIVFNEPNYPNFVRLLDEIGVPSQPTSMSFSFASERSGLEFAGDNLNTLFTQRSNLLRPRHYRFLADILRFNRAAKHWIAEARKGTLADFLSASRLSPALAEQYLIPLTSAIWSADPRRILETPALFLLRFLDNHRLLDHSERPVWRVIQGGSEEYVKRLIRPFRDRIRKKTPVRRLRRRKEGVEILTEAGKEVFEEVVVAAHSDQALRMLDSPTPEEAEVLGAIRYQPNPAALHTDVSVLPKSRRAWASWNYRTLRETGRPVAVTYNMNRLQGLDSKTTWCVSLNLEDRIASDRVLARFDFEHPHFDQAAVAAQQRCSAMSGRDRIHYAGAWRGHGFHEDGVVSALEVARRMGVPA